MTVKTISLGCRLNAYESERMADKARAVGLDNAIIVNTCAVTAKAVTDSKRSVRRAIKNAPNAPVLVTGCAAQITPEAFQDIAGITSLIGNADKLRDTTWRGLGQGETIDVGDVMTATDLPAQLAEQKSQNVRAMVQVQNGCDHRCTFCIIPFGRGNSRSVPTQQVIEKIKRLVDLGHKEIVLTGVDLTSWGGDLDGNPQLGTLIETILHDIPDLPQLRISSIDAIEIDPAFKDVMAETRLAPYLHLSLQHGDTMILKRMKRRHTREDAIDLCAELRTIRPDIAFGADLIAGFPTETEAHFNNTLKLVEACDLAFVHAFPFSPRPDTPAARMPQIDPRITKERAARLRQAADIARIKHLDKHVGKTLIALTESGNKARLPDFTQIILDADDIPIGEFTALTLYNHDGAMLLGRPSTIGIL